MQNLTNRELELLNAIKNGLTNREIAKKLNISVSTVKFHLNSAIQKLNAKNRINAIYIACTNKIIE